MIRKLVGVVVLVLIGAGLMYYALGHHFVKTKEGTITVPKASLGLADTYVNITEWKAADFADHPEVTKALIDNGHEDVVLTTAAGGVIEWLKNKAGEVLSKPKD